MRGIPDGWRQVELRDVAETSLGKMLDAARPKGAHTTPYLRNTNVQWSGVDTSDVLTVPLSDDERERFLLETGDLLVCEGGEIGRAAIWRGSAGSMAYQKALHRVRSKGELDLRWLRYLLEHYATTGVLAARATGSTIKHLPQQQLRQLPVPLPPLAEQARVVLLLEDHLSRLDAAASLLAKAAARMVAFAEAWLASEPSLFKAEHLPLQRLLASPLRHGRSVPTAEQGFPVLRLTALSGRRVDLTQRKVGAWDADQAAPFLVAQGDFLVARGSGSLHLVGRGSFVGEEAEPVAFPDTAIRVRLAEHKMTPQFLSLIWSSRPVRSQIEALAKTTAGIHKINQADLAGIQVPVPSLDQQRDILSRADEAALESQRLAKAIEQAQLRSRVLRRSLLSSALSGRLSNDAVSVPACDHV